MDGRIVMMYDCQGSGVSASSTVRPFIVNITSPYPQPNKHT